MDQSSLTIAGLLAALGIAVSAVAIARQGAGAPLVSAQPGDVIPPQRGLTVPSGESFPVTIHEYSDEIGDKVTGNWITYSFTPQYYNGLLPKPGQAALLFSIGFDLDTGAPWASMPRDLWRAHPSTDAGREKSRRHVVARLSARFGGFPIADHLLAAKERGAVELSDIPNLTKRCFGDYRWIGEEFCGWEMSEQCGRHNALARAGQDYPFSSASIFGKPGGQGGYERIVECNQSSEHGWCWAREPHPIAKSYLVFFGGNNLCTVDDVVDAANGILADHVFVEESNMQ